jgi:ribosomal protein L24
MANANMNDERMFRLTTGSRIYITGGQYRDYRGTIREILSNEYVVDVDGLGIRHVQSVFCDPFLTEGPDDVPSMMLPPANRGDFPQVGDRVYLNGGLYTGQKGTMVTVNVLGNHTVDVDGLEIRYIPIGECEPLQPKGIPPRRDHGMGRQTTTEVLIDLLVESMLENDTLTIQEWLIQLQERIAYHTQP